MLFCSNDTHVFHKPCDQIKYQSSFLGF